MDRIPLEEPRWHAVMTKPREESIAARWLVRAGYWAAYPLDRFQVRRRRGNGRSVVEWIERPHFPRYVFVALRYVNEALGPINDTPGVSRLVCRRLSGEPLQIPGPVMQAILDSRIVELDDGRGGLVISETHLHGDRELRVFVDKLRGRWKTQEMVA